MAEVSENNFVSIIWVHYSMNKARAELALECLDSLIESVDYPSELIVVDNGGKPHISDKLLAYAKSGRITTYIRNRDNVFFGAARNQGARLSTGKYLAFIDNDLMFMKGWVKECVKVLDNTEDLFCTPLQVDRQHLSPSFYKDPIEIDGKTYEVNTWAGSNCWMMKREDWEKVGPFENHHIAGTKWNRRFSHAGYAVAVQPECKAMHIGLRGTPYKGYKKKHVEYDMRKTLSDGSKVEA